MHESSHPDCSTPDLSLRKAHTGIQICQAQQVRELRLIMLGTYNRAGPEPQLHAHTLHSACWDYLKTSIYRLAFQLTYRCPDSLIDRRNKSNKRGLELQKIQGNQDADAIHVKRIWGNLGKSCKEIFLFPQSSPLTSCFQLLL